jgi:hypothetical protein
MSAQSRRAFLGLAAKAAIAAAAMSTLGTGFIETAEAMPIAPEPELVREPSRPVVQAQWGPPGGPRRRPAGWRRPPRRRRRRWVCRWHRGRRRCGWQWT